MIRQIDHATAKRTESYVLGDIAPERVNEVFAKIASEVMSKGRIVPDTKQQRQNDADILSNPLARIGYLCRRSTQES